MLNGKRNILAIFLVGLAVLTGVPTAYASAGTSNATQPADTLLAADLREYLPGFLKSPAPKLAFLEVSNVSSSSATITWVSRDRYTGSVDYGPTKEFAHHMEEDRAGHVHFLLLRDLPANQKILFRVQSGAAESKILSFRTAPVAAGIPRTVYGSLPTMEAGSVTDRDVLVHLRLLDQDNASLPLSVPITQDDLWLLNLGNLKTEGGQPFAYDDEMTAAIRIEGIGSDGKPQTLHNYTIRLSDAPGGDLSPAGSQGIQTASNTVSPRDRANPRPQAKLSIASQDGMPTPEREFLENLL
ncbi:hypothetical protein ACFL6M_05365, partial [Candidatus Eisenbacteria bacterium]